MTDTPNEPIPFEDEPGDDGFPADEIYNPIIGPDGKPYEGHEGPL